MDLKNYHSSVSIVICSYILGTLLLLLSLEVDLCSSLKISLLLVPSPTIAGEPVELICGYEMEGEKLYSVKWYKDDAEFYRYVPNDYPPAQNLPDIEGIKVDLFKSGNKSVYLKRVDLNSEGKYKCEVSGEAPEFKTAEDEKEMKVYVLPQEGPQITGSKTKYGQGDTANLTCISAKSKPAATLKWLINDKEAPDEFQTKYPTEIHPDGLETSRRSLQFKIDAEHFRDGNMKLKCIATSPNDFSMSTLKTLHGDRRHPFLHAYSNRAKLGSSSSSPSISANNNKIQLLYCTVSCFVVHSFTAIISTLHNQLS
ncbi:uncharacterized protein LOC141854575 [Brevipalpus obovatus]|uniref:uncharacterized protein LOC141854575 n=1 Tax=Brevipalpus obovatus TaxID=246614 RepID=UPI003D9EC6FC